MDDPNSSTTNLSGIEVVNIRKANLNSMGYRDLSEWVSVPGNIYIGRDMSRFVAGAVGSKWQNLFRVGKQASREKCCGEYEKYILTDNTIQANGKTLFQSLEELKGKNIGCWCHPEMCHGHVLKSLVEKYCCSEEVENIRKAKESFHGTHKISTWKSGVDSGSSDWASRGDIPDRRFSKFGQLISILIKTYIRYLPRQLQQELLEQWVQSGARMNQLETYAKAISIWETTKEDVDIINLLSGILVESNTKKLLSDQHQELSRLLATPKQHCKCSTTSTQVNGETCNGTPCKKLYDEFKKEPLE